jgi:alpha-galactosidase
MFNSWGYERAIDEPTMRQALGLCARLGLEAFVTDFGWEGPDWLPRPETFPRGLAPLSDLCRSRGMKFGMHFSFANVAESSRLYKEHPDWTYGEGCWAYGQSKHPVYALSLGLPEARKWAVDKVAEVLDREKADWLITDSQLWGTIDPAKHVINADQDYLAATGFEQTMAAIHARRPKVLIEHCDGGLSLLNYKMMAQHATSVTCDNAQAIDTRLSVWDLSRILPPRYLDKYQQEWRSHYANRSCMLGGPWILMMPIHTLAPGSRDWNELAEDIALYKHYRARIRDGKVLHLLAPSVPADKAWDGWDAIGSYNPLEDAAIVFAFRTRGGPQSRAIPMKSLKPGQTYRVTLCDARQSYRASGRAIMKDGIALTLDAYASDPHAHCSEIILIEPENGE